VRSNAFLRYRYYIFHSLCLSVLFVFLERVVVLVYPVFVPFLLFGGYASNVLFYVRCICVEYFYYTLGACALVNVIFHRFLYDVVSYMLFDSYVVVTAITQCVDPTSNVISSYSHHLFAAHVFKTIVRLSSFL